MYADSLGVLVITDKTEYKDRVVSLLESNDYVVSVKQTSSVEGIENALACQEWDVILLEYKLSRMSMIDALKTIRDLDSQVPAIVVSDTVNIETVVEALKHGASNFVDKSNPTRLISIISKEIYESELQKEYDKIEFELSLSEKKLQTLIHSLTDIVLVIDKDGLITELYISDHTQSLMSTIPVLGTKLSSHIPPKIVQNYNQSSDVVRNTGKSERIIYSLESNEDFKWVSLKIMSHNIGKNLIVSIRDVSEIVNIKAVLDKERNLAQRYLDIAGVIILVISTNFDVIRINKMGCEVLGYSEEEIVGRNWFDNFVPDDSKDRIFSIFEGLNSNDSDLHRYTETKVKTKNGEERLIAWHNVALFNDTGDFTGTLSSGEDITERRKMETELLKNEYKFRTLVSNIVGAVYRCNNDEHWTMKYLSDEIENISGYPSSDFICNIVRSYESIIHPDDRNEVRKAVMDSIADEQRFSIEYRIIHSDGGVRWILESGQGIYDVTSLLYIDGVIYDVTDKKQTELALRENEERFRGVYDSSPIGIQILDSNGIVLEANRACLRMFGVSKVEDLQGFDIYTDPNTPSKVKEAVRRKEIIRVETEFAFDIVKKLNMYQSSCEGSLYIDATYVPLYSSTGSDTGYLVMMKDITEQKNAEMDLKKQSGNLKERVKELTCLQEASKLFTSKQPLEVILQELVEISRQAWQYPEVTCIHAVYGTLEFATKNFAETKWNLKAEIRGSSDRDDFLEVSYLEEKPTEDEGPFLREERELIDALAEGLGIYIESINAEDSLQKSEERYRNLFVSAPVAIWEEDYSEVGKWLENLRQDGITDLEKFLSEHPEAHRTAVGLVQITSVNNLAVEMYEADSKDALVGSLLEIASDDTLEKTKRELIALWTNDDRIIRTEERAITLKGNSIETFVVWSISKIQGELDLSNVIVAVSDITELKQAQKELENAKDRAEFFVDLMGHDLSNINQAISGTLELALLDEGLSSNTIDTLNETHHQINRATQLITNVRKLRMIENQVPDLKQIDLETILSSAIVAVRNDVPERTLRINKEIIPLNLAVYADDYLYDVFYNLVHNAVIHSRTNIVDLIITAKIVNQRRTIRIIFEDSGPGIPDSMKDLLFARISKKKEGYWGTGIGLTLTKHIIDYYNWKIWVEDNASGDSNKGASFIIDIPCHS